MFKSQLGTLEWKWVHDESFISNFNFLKCGTIFWKTSGKNNIEVEPLVLKNVHIVLNIDNFYDSWFSTCKKIKETIRSLKIA